MLRRSRTAPLVISLAALTIAACGGSDETSSDGTSSDEPNPDAAESLDVDDAVNTDDAPAGETASDGGLGPDDVGRGLLRIDGVEYDSFTGNCEISRASGSEPVGDLSVAGLTTIVAIDNVAAGDPDTLDDDLNFLMTNEENFRVRNTQRGTIESIREVGPRTSDGSTDYVVVAFSGTLDDGSQVEAEVVCDLWNGA